MADVVGLKRVQQAIRRLAEKYDEAGVTVGYTQRYAIHVHERKASHPTGQWKYLETPARKLKGEIAKIFLRVLKRTGSIEKALLVAGLRLQRESQDKFVPVLTGALKASAFTARAKDIEAVANAAFSVSERKRMENVRKSKGQQAIRQTAKLL